VLLNLLQLLRSSIVSNDNVVRLASDRLTQLAAVYLNKLVGILSTKSLLVR
jgi:hypothetical protein